MDANECPHCGFSPAISFWNKAAIGPARILSCHRCGRPVTVASRSCAIVLLGGFAGVAASNFASVWSQILAFVASFLFLYIYQWRWVDVVPPPRDPVQSATVRKSLSLALAAIGLLLLVSALVRGAYTDLLAAGILFACGASMYVLRHREEKRGRRVAGA